MLKVTGLILITIALAGCASTITSREAPEYDYASHSLVGPGYPVERVIRPDGFSLVDTASETTREDPDFSPGAKGKLRVTEARAVWISRDGDTAVAGAMQLGLDARTSRGYWQPWSESQGTETVSGERYQYAMYAGSYDDVVWYPNTIPNDAPGCGVGVQFQRDSTNREKRTRLIYSEGINCDELVSYGRNDERRLRERALRILGIKSRYQ